MSGIEWTDETWNPVVGCTRASRGCDNCYAVTMTHRLEAMGQERYAGLTVLNGRGHRHFNGVVRTVPEALDKPLKWRKPRRVFVNSMADLFHPEVPFEFIDRVFAVMALCPQHVFQVLTKRPERMAEYLRYAVEMDNLEHEIDALTSKVEGEPFGLVSPSEGQGWPLPNVWLGTSVEDQAAADERVPHLLRCPAAVRFLSCEPLLGPVDLRSIDTGRTWPGKSETSNIDALMGFSASQRDEPNPVSMTRAGEFIEHERSRFIDYDYPAIDWIIVGGESGAKARPCDVAWLRGIVQQGQRAGVPVFVKQLGSKPWYVDHDARRCGGAVVIDVNALVEGWKHDGPRLCKDPKGGDPNEWPEDLRVRQWPVGEAAKAEAKG